jgi:hypothetical protein
MTELASRELRRKKRAELKPSQTKRRKRRKRKMAAKWEGERMPPMRKRARLFLCLKSRYLQIRHRKEKIQRKMRWCHSQSMRTWAMPMNCRWVTVRLSLD